MKSHVQRFDASLTRSIISLFGHSTRPFFAAVTHLGDPLPIIAVTLYVTWLGISSYGTGMVAAGVVIPATVIVGALLKIAFERARPVTEYALAMKLQTFSFPSGHSTGSMIAYGTLAYLMTGIAGAGIAMFMVPLLIAVPVFVGISRVYLGAHFPSDVIAGWALGAAALLITIFVIKPFI